MLKIAFVGAGSAVFARQLITDILAVDGLDEGVIALVDIDAARLELARQIAERLIELSGKRWSVTASTERVDVHSRRGIIRGLDLRLTETIGAGQVFVPFHWAEANANQATQSAFDPVSREPNYKQCAVRVERSQ